MCKYIYCFKNGTPTSLKASLSSFTPIMSAVSANIFGPISSTKSSKSTLPPPSEHTHDRVRSIMNTPHMSSSDIYAPLSLSLSITEIIKCTMISLPLTDLLTEFNQLHLCGHVAHRPHAFAQILTGNEAVLIFVKLSKGFFQL